MNRDVADIRKRYVAASLRRYWTRGEDLMLRLPVPQSTPSEIEPLPPRLTTVALPEWAADLGLAEGLLVAEQFIVPGGIDRWRRVDWWAAVHWFLCGLAERAYERAHGPIHSYSFRLKGWDTRMWEHAWANRIALFLRRWAARELGQDEHSVLGALPVAEVIVTHDVDAIRKTSSIRLKQTAFYAYNSLRLAASRRPQMALDKLASAIRFFFSSPDYWHFDEIQTAEERAQVRSCFYVYGGDPRQRSLKQALLDPAYDAREPRLAAKLRTLVQNGWQVGLHQSFEAWSDSARMLEEKSRVAAALETAITMCRQHWLRFSWQDTWKAQQAAGLQVDATLGFNDRPGFRNGAALRFHPWDDGMQTPLRLTSLPVVLMDSHLYDYACFDNEQRPRELRRWIDEVRAVRGSATMLWHVHVLAHDYGWKPGFHEFLALASEAATLNERG